MNIGIIVYTQTNHTGLVAEKLEKRLTADGHSVKLEKILVTESSKPEQEKIEYKYKPETDPYDGLVFASPVHGFTLSVVMTHFLKQISSLKNKKVVLFLT